MSSQPILMAGLRSNNTSSTIVDSIWGTRLTEFARQDRLTALKWYLNHWNEEEEFILRRDPQLFDNISLSNLITHIKTNPHIPKRDLLSHQAEHNDLTSLTVAIELIVKLAFLTACLSISQETIGGDLFRPRWDESESFEAYISRVYPRNLQPPQDARSIRLDKIAVGYLTTYAKLDFAWTHRLTDHLMLLKRSNRKTLYIFRHPGFLKVSLDCLKANHLSFRHSLADTLSLGCLPPQLLRETLATFNILFPEPGDELSQSILQREVSRFDLDESFLKLSTSQYGEHEHPRDALDPEDVHNLYQKYPYWGDRLYTLWKEADDPTPITTIERWSESRRNPRFTYWCTVVSLTFAILFGVIATILSALQVWISYCGWIDNPTNPFCRKDH